MILDDSIDFIGNCFFIFSSSITTKNSSAMYFEENLALKCNSNEFEMDNYLRPWAPYAAENIEIPNQIICFTMSKTLQRLLGFICSLIYLFNDNTLLISRNNHSWRPTDWFCMRTQLEKEISRKIIAAIIY